RRPGCFDRRVHPGDCRRIQNLFARNEFSFLENICKDHEWGRGLRTRRGNAAAFLRYYVRAETKKLGFLVPPIIGFVICLALWLNLSRPAIIVGSIWMGAGILFGIWKTNWFQKPLSFELPPEE